jgi:hypothetical protein
MIGDVLALQSIYGANLSVHQGNDTYSIGNNNMFQTIFDALGSNTLDARGSSHAWKIDLSVAAPGVGHPYQIGLANPSDENLAVPTSLYWLYGNFKTIYCSNQNDTIICSPTGNVIYLGNGMDVIVGGISLDVVVKNNVSSNYKLSPYGYTSIALTNILGKEGTDILTNIERLKFTDTNLALDISKDQTAGSAYMLYKAAFNRQPDVGGLGFWINKMDGGMSYDTVAQNFVNSAEFKTAFGGSNPSVNTLVTKLYNNVLNRAPEVGGFIFWQGKLTTGGWTVANVLGYFATSAENVANVTPLIANGIAYQEWVG